MEFIVIPLVAIFASFLTLISGFGLGTLLLPAFAAFFPLERAIALTALVHLANNLFKLALVGFRARREIVLRFGVAAVLAAIVGALLLTRLGTFEPLGHYDALGATRALEPVNLAVAALMILFAVIELSPRFNRLELDSRWLPLGGVLSGFLGGLTGHQGALRSPFLLRYKRLLDAPSFIASNVVISCAVDLARIPIYGTRFAADDIATDGPLMITAALAAFVGAAVGAKYMKKLTLGTVQRAVAICLVVIAILIGGGFVGGR
jgi:uncharacterized protein